MTNPTPPYKSTPPYKFRFFRTFNHHNIYRKYTTYALSPSLAKPNEEFFLTITISDGSQTHTQFEFMTKAEVAKVIFGEDD